jgi:hypothetical protein
MQNNKPDPRYAENLTTLELIEVIMDEPADPPAPFINEYIARERDAEDAAEFAVPSFIGGGWV